MNPPVNTLDDIKKSRRSYVEELKIRAANEDLLLLAQKQKDILGGDPNYTPDFMTQTEKFNDVLALKVEIFSIMKDYVSPSVVNDFLYTRRLTDAEVIFIAKRIGFIMERLKKKFQPYSINLTELQQLLSSLFRINPSASSSTPNVETKQEPVEQSKPNVPAPKINVFDSPLDNPFAAKSEPRYGLEEIRRKYEDQGSFFQKARQDEITQLIDNSWEKARIEAPFNPDAQTNPKVRKSRRLEVKRSKVKTGRGVCQRREIAASEVDFNKGFSKKRRFIPFGRYLLSQSHLENNVISLRYPHMGNNVNRFKTKAISSKLKAIIDCIIERKSPPFEMLAELSSDDKDYLHQLCSVSQIDANFSIPNEKKNNEQKLLDRFELLRGQIVAGNDSKELISEFKRILIKLKETRRLPKAEVAEIMSFLLEMGY